MPLDLTAIGRSTDPVLTSWTGADALLYSVAVGAGQDPLAELSLTTENTEQVRQVVLPTFAALIAQRSGRPDIGSYDRAMLVHAEQSVDLPRSLPADGAVRLVATIDDIVDKGSGALVRTSVTATYPNTGDVVFTTRSSAFIRGEGGFDENRSRRPTTSSESTEGTADSSQADGAHTVEQITRPEQALIYRLTGDRNPLHSDPAFAARAGFGRPILHGMCTFGFSARAVVAAFGGDPTAIRTFGGRFTAPVIPGDTLRTEIWVDGNRARFRTLRSDGVVVIDRGTATRA